MKLLKKRKKPGFALLEAVMFSVLVLLLGTAMLAAASNTHRRSVQRAQNDRAYNAAVAALKMAGDEVAQGLTSFNNPFSDWAFTLEMPGADGANTVHSNIVLSGSGISCLPEGITGMSLTATATVGEQTETVTLTLQKVAGESWPHTLFGAGFAGHLATENTALTLGPDTDLMLYGYPAGSQLTLSGASVGGNLVARGVALTLSNAALGGTAVSDSALTIENTTIGTAQQSRLAGVYCTASLSLFGESRVQGNVYAFYVNTRGKVVMGENCNIWAQDWTDNRQTVMGADGTAHFTTDPALARGGTLEFSGSGQWRQLTQPLSQPLAQLPTRFVPTLPANIETHSFLESSEFTPGVPQAQGLLLTVADGASLTLTAAPAAANGTPAIFVRLGKNASLILKDAGEYSLFVYGSDPQQSRVQLPSGCHIRGSLQDVSLTVTGTAPSLSLTYTAPAQKAYQSPSSAGYATDTWRVLGMRRHSASN